MSARLNLVGSFGVEITLETVHAQLAAIPATVDEVEVYIDSPGGSILTAMLVWESMKSYPFWYRAVGKTVHSAATYVFFMIGERSVAIDAGPDWLIIHMPTTTMLPEGLDIDDLEKYTAALRAFTNRLAHLYGETFGIPSEIALQKMKDETIYTPDQARLLGIAATSKNMGLIDELKALKGELSTLVLGVKATTAPPVEDPVLPAEEGEDIEAIKAELASYKAKCEDYEAKFKAMEEDKTDIESLVAQVQNSIKDLKNAQTVGAPSAKTAPAVPQPSGNPALDRLQSQIGNTRKW